MHRIALVVTISALALAGCARQAASADPPSAAPVRGKPRAPVEIDARLSTGSARVVVRFDADARDVRIGVQGADGLVVTSAATPVAATPWTKSARSA